MTDRIKELRKKVFKTQLEMARVLNLSPQAVNEYERGNSFLKPEKIALLINNYNINANWLLAGKGSMLLTEADIRTVAELNKEIEHLKIENNLLKELINKK